MKKQLPAAVFIVNFLGVAYLLYAFIFIHGPNVSEWSNVYPYTFPWKDFIIGMVCPLIFFACLILFWRVGKKKLLAKRLFWVLGILFPIYLLVGFLGLYNLFQ
jgi:hypothetical protein